MNKERRNRIIGFVLLALAGLSLLALNYLLQKSIPFKFDDIWYGRKLGTEEPLESVKDIWEFQKWHYLNWGGRSVTHTILQFVMMAGPTVADILNVIMFVLLSFVAVRFTGKVSPRYMLLFAGLLIAFNPNLYDTMFWQSGVLNYLYSTTWILLFNWFYFRSLSEDYIPPKGISIFMIPLAIMTGWSNENMGPASFCMALLTILYLVKKKRKVPVFMYLGAFFSLAGSAAMLLAPGNFIRSNLVEGGFLEKIKIHISEWSRATFIYLGSLFLLSILLFMIYVYVMKKQVTIGQVFLLIFTILSQGAMILSPTYPTRATFGVLAVTLCFDTSLLREMEADDKKVKIAYNLLTALVYFLAMMILIEELRYPTR